MAADLSGVTYFAPIVAFLIVFLVCALLFLKVKILGDNKWMAIFVSLLIAALFVSFGSVRRYVEVVTPWFAVFMISLFFILMIVAFSFQGKIPEGFQKGLGLLFVLGLLAAFIISGVTIFSSELGFWLPGSIESFDNPLYAWISSPPILGAIILIVLTAAVSWVLVKKG